MTDGPALQSLPPPALPAARVEALLARRPRSQQVALLCDTRPLHRLIALQRGARRPPDGPPGRYRQPGEHVVMRLPMPGAPMLTKAVPPEAILPEMTDLARRIEALLNDPPPPAQARSALVEIFARFLLVHPYRDGNGRIARLLFRRAAILSGIPLGERWTLDRRPYGGGLSMALRCAEHAPQMMDRFMARYFADLPAAG